MVATKFVFTMRVIKLLFYACVCVWEGGGGV